MALKKILLKSKESNESNQYKTCKEAANKKCVLKISVTFLIIRHNSIE